MTRPDSATPQSTPARPPSEAVPLARLLDHAADTVAGVIAGRSLTDLLEQVPQPVRPGVQALSFQALRRLGGARAVLRQLASRRPPPRVESLLLVVIGLAWPGDPPAYAEHTLVDQAVACARRRSAPQASFVNAVLRRYLRERETIVAGVGAKDIEARTQHPRWWVETLRRDWPGQWEALLRAADERPPFSLRVNRRRLSAQAYVERLAQSGIEARVTGAQAVTLARPCPVDQLPGFAEGDVSVQDLAAQVAARLVVGGTDAAHAAGETGTPDAAGAAGDAEATAPLPPGARVLDACAAPGGKTAHLLELADLDVLALDSDATRLARVRSTLDRLGLAASLLHADARQPSQWWDGRPFDAILLDAPCSASGIVRRHPDIRWLRRAADLDALARTQDELLDALWPLLRPGGRLVYATCSLFKREGEERIAAFMQRTADVIRLPAPGHMLPLADNDAGESGAPGITPDGFYYARLQKSDRPTP